MESVLLSYKARKTKEKFIQHGDIVESKEICVWNYLALPDPARSEVFNENEAWDCSGQICGAGVLYGVFDYGDETQVNEIHGGAIMWQLVCSGYCYSMLILWGPIDPSCRERAVRRTREQIPDTTEPKERARLSLSSPLLTRRTTGWWCTKKPTLECHKSRSKLYSPDRSNLSGMYHRSKSTGSKKEKRAEVWRGEGRRGEWEKEERMGRKKSLYRVIGRSRLLAISFAVDSRAEKL